MTCKCIIGWVKDDSVSGEHNIKPVTCAEYTTRLEEAILTGNADLMTLVNIRRECGVAHKEDVLPDLDSRAEDLAKSIVGQIHISDTIKDIESWRDEVISQIAATGRARITPVSEVEFSIEWIGEYEREHYAGVSESLISKLREMGYAIWDRPPGRLFKSSDGTYQVEDIKPEDLLSDD